MNRRKHIADIEYRQMDGSNIEADGQTLRGLAIPFGQMSKNLGGFVEIMSDNLKVDHYDGDVFALAYHDFDIVLGRLSAGTLQLNRSEVGIESVISLPDTTQANDLAVSVARGDIRNQSFGFSVKQDEWTAQKGGLDLRMVKHIELVEVSVVTLPAYGSTDIALAQRSLQAHNIEIQRRRRQRVLDLLA